MPVEPVELLGLVAAVLVIVSWLPQLQKSVRTKSTGDLSWGMLLILLASQILWLIYGLLIDSIPVALTNAATTLFLSALALMKYKYDAKNQSPKGGNL